MRASFQGIAAAIAFLSAVTPSVAQELKGWCLPVDDCVGAQIRIGEGRFDTCEETCEIRKPVRINGMNAFAYDEICQGDMGTNKSRIIVAQTKTGVDTTLYYISNSYVAKLEPCN